MEAAGRTFLQVSPEALRLMAYEAIHDIQHLLRPAHLAQLRRTAKSTGIQSLREHARIMANLVKGWPTLDVLPDDGVPITAAAANAQVTVRLDRIL